MLDEFEDELEPDDLPKTGARSAPGTGIQPRAARLVSRLYRAAGTPLRSRIIAYLVRPLGSLGLAGVASGAFAGLLSRGAEASAGVAIGDLAQYSTDQIFELARFVEQASPDALAQLAGFLTDNPVAVSAFSAAVAMLLVRSVRGLRAKSADAAPQSTGRSHPAEAGSGHSGGQARTSSGHGSMAALDELVRRARERPRPDPGDAVCPD